jgi:uncharacterized protein YbaP (TraB family)
MLWCWLFPAFGIHASPFFRIEEKGNVVYLLASTHSPIGKNDPEKLRGITRIILKEVDAVYFEALMPDASRLAALRAKYVFFPTGQSLADMLSEDTLKGTQKIVGAHAVDPVKAWKVLSAQRPYFTLNTLDFMVIGKPAGKDTNALALDAMLVNETRAMGIQEREIEGLDLQLPVLASFSKDLSERAFKCVIGASESEAVRQSYYSYFAKLDQKIFDGATDQVFETLTNESPCEATRDAVEATIVIRNANMFQRLEELLSAGKPVLIAVGAFHFGGPRGLLALAREHGYKIVQIDK